MNDGEHSLARKRDNRHKPPAIISANVFLPKFEGLIFVFRVEIQRIVYTNASRRDLKDSQAVVILRISCP